MASLVLYNYYDDHGFIVNSYFGMHVPPTITTHKLAIVGQDLRISSIPGMHNTEYQHMWGANFPKLFSAETRDSYAMFIMEVLHPN